MTTDEQQIAAPSSERAVLRAAALGLAARGIDVFPCRPRGKAPATRSGFHDATTDAGQVAAWWSDDRPALNIGVPTGMRFDVIDVDPPHGAASLAELEAAGLIPTVVMRVETPRGGLHLYIRPTGDGCTTGLLPGIDYRGRGGYVLAPPSKTETGVWTVIDGGWESFAVETGAGSAGSFLESAAAWKAIRALGASASAQRVSTEALGPVLAVSSGDPFASPSGWASTALRREVERVHSAPEGTRNHALNRAAFSLGQIVAGGALDEVEVALALEEAAEVAGLGRDEIEATIRSGLRAGYAEPRTAPDRENDREDVDAVLVRSSIRDRLPVIDWHALWATEDREEWIVEPLLPARRLIAIYSAPKVGKSLLMLEIAVAVSRGTSILGIIPDRRRRVLYVDFENDPRGDVRSRLKAMGVGPDDLDWLDYLSYPALGGLDSAQGGALLMAAVDEYASEVVVIDTVSRSVDGEENANDTWLNFYRHTGLALKRAEVALVRLDHSGKDVTKGQRGGSAKSGDVDAIWRLSKVSDTVFRLDCEDTRMPIMEKTLVLHRETDPLRHRVDGRGGAAAWDAKIAEIVAALDASGLPPSTGRDGARAALQASGIKASNAAITEALLRWRVSS